ncbi:MAG TPA: hypothetical protein VF294_06225, partial [Polyangiaceae bacterium]
NTATAVTPTDSTNPVPTFNQGTIKAGTYFLTKRTYYTGAGTHTLTAVTSTLKITVVGSVATLNIIEGTARYTLTITMSSNTANAPTEEKLTCTSDQAVSGPTGTITGAIDYDMGATLFTAYLPGTHVRNEYTIQP